MGYRIERDFLGEKRVPEDAYYGVQTVRGKDNFHITGMPVSREPYFVKAFGYVKKAAAMANRDLGVLDRKIADAIISACDRVIAGEMDDQFVTDFIQGGAGTSTNMNANEVIANLALESLGHKKGEYQHVNPNDHVNFGQSTNEDRQVRAQPLVHDPGARRDRRFGADRPRAREALVLGRTIHGRSNREAVGSCRGGPIRRSRLRHPLARCAAVRADAVRRRADPRQRHRGERRLEVPRRPEPGPGGPASPLGAARDHHHDGVPGRAHLQRRPGRDHGAGAQRDVAGDRG